MSENREHTSTHQREKKRCKEKDQEIKKDKKQTQRW